MGFSVLVQGVRRPADPGKINKSTSAGRAGNLGVGGKESVSTEVDPGRLWMRSVHLGGAAGCARRSAHPARCGSLDAG